RRPDAPPRRGQFVASHAFFGLSDLREEVGDSTLPTFVSLHLYKKVSRVKQNLPMPVTGGQLAQKGPLAQKGKGKREWEKKTAAAI
ncbi:hypothetical protein U6X56_12330, partial [Cutibacterium acnes]